MDDYKNQIIECAAQFAIDDDIFEDDNLADLGIDSLKTVELLLSLEETFGIEFDSSSLNPTDLTTVKSLIELVEQYIGEDK